MSVNMAVTAQDIGELGRAIDAWRWGGDQNDEEMLRTYARDRERLGKIRDAVEDGNLKRAERLALGLDTIVREQIPNLLYYKIIGDDGAVKNELRRRASQGRGAKRRTPTRKTLEEAARENIAALREYSKWTGKTPAERELINAIRVSVSRMRDALAEDAE